MPSRITATRATVAAATVAALLLAGCGGSSHHKTRSSATTRPAPAPSTSAKAAKPHAAHVVKRDPLNGGTPSANPVIAVKIDDTADGRPQVNVDQADIVYVEQVEGGLSRLIAVFHTKLPSRVEPIRSVRSNDPELLTQYGRIGLVASGGGGDALPAVARSILKANIADLGGAGFSRDPARADVGQGDENLQINLQTVISAVHPAKAKSIGWTWNPSRKQIAHAPKATSLATIVGGTPVGFTWNARMGKYQRVIDGQTQHAADGAPIATPNVIVQFCHGHVNPADVDQAGNPGYFTETIGHGHVAVFRGGKVVSGTWTRNSATDGTALRTKKGAPIQLAPGGAWVVLVATGAQLTIG